MDGAEADGVQDGPDGGTTMVLSPSGSAGASATGAESGGPGEYTSIGASQFEHLPSVPGVLEPHVGHCIAQTSPYRRFAHVCDPGPPDRGGRRFPRKAQGSRQK